MDCLFCRIAARETASHEVFDDELSLAFLDHRPLFPGHCLLIPKQHYETLADLPPALVGPFFATVRMVAQAIEMGLEADGSFVAINNRVSQSVPHLHVHIVPRRRKDGLKGFFWPRQKYPDGDAILKVQQAIRSAVTKIAGGA